MAYRGYVKDFPKGAFVEKAKEQIARLEEPVLDPALLRATQVEAALGLSDTAKRLIELRLNSLDFTAGEPDGVFDAATRRALRRFQASRNLRVTGFVDQATMISLLAGR